MNILFKIVCIFFLTFSFSCNNTSTVPETAKDEKALYYEDFLKNLYFSNLANSNSRIASTILVKDQNGDSIGFSQIIGKMKYKLVLHYPEPECIACLQEQLLVLKKVKDCIDNDIFLFIVSFINIRPFAVILKASNIPYKYYNLGFKDLGIVGQDRMFYCLVDKNGVMSNFFYPDKAFPAITYLYLRIVLQKYFNSPPSCFPADSI
ncbi:MAG: hypothetical protein NTV01_20065 [Bacteroidia bacterium]|nr:hypothetical protein [Bacteroidia bacterium]